jgi:putative endonuclease
MYFVYAIRSLHFNYIYVGQTKNIDCRLMEHNSKKNRSTKAYTPFELFYQEGGFATREQAREREKYLKSGVGKEFLKTYIKVM